MSRNDLFDKIVLRALILGYLENTCSVHRDKEKKTQIAKIERSAYQTGKMINGDYVVAHIEENLGVCFI